MFLSNYQPTINRLTILYLSTIYPLVNQAVSKYEQEFIGQNIDKRKRRKEKLAGPPTDGQVIKRTGHSDTNPM